MKITCDMANKIVRSLNEERSSLLRKEMASKEYSFMDGEEPIVPEYDFGATQSEFQNIEHQIGVLKHAINQFNITTAVYQDMTIDEVLVRLPMLNQRKSTLIQMKDKLPEQKQVGYNGKSSIITKTNYDATEVEVEYNRIDKEIMAMQNALNVANMTIEFEVDI